MLSVKEFTLADSALCGHIASAECKSGLQIEKLVSVEYVSGGQIGATEYA